VGLDVRNSKVFEVIKELREFGIEPVVYDPIAREEEVKEEFDIELEKDYKAKAPYDAILYAVRHRVFLETFTLEKLKRLSCEPSILFDIKGVFDRKDAEELGFIYWRL
jgi:UDP-N-acetyl-D-galactosamine dehydrogenase